MNRRLVAVLAVPVALMLWILAARAVSGPEKEVVPVIQLDRGQGPPPSTTIPTPEPGVGPGTPGAAVETVPPTVPSARPRDTAAVSPRETTPTMVIGDEEEDDGAGPDDQDGGEDDDEDDGAEVDHDEGPAGSDDGGEEDDDD